MQEIITILIVATIPIVGIAILFWIIRLCKIFNQTNNRDGEISRLIQERDTLMQEKNTLTQQIAHLTDENTALQETTADYLSQWNETTSEIRAEIANIPKIYIERGWAFPDVPPDRRTELIRMARAGRYPEFLRTREWGRVATMMKIHFNRRCQTCNSNNNLEVHHRTYERVGEECPGDLTVLCRTCHQLIHDNRPIPPIPNGDGDC